MKSNTISIILLAGGTGTRMQSKTPKQFMLVNQKPIVQYSLEAFASLKNVGELIIVCDEPYRSFVNYHGNIPMKFTLPGARRQDSVRNGFALTNPQANLICIHDTARPFINLDIIESVIQAAYEVGAAAAAVPMKCTVKETDGQQFVIKTPDRSKLWEIQTPQVIRSDLLAKGFSLIEKDNRTVTDDVSLVELIPHPVKLVQGSYQNIKITTPEDLIIAEQIAKNL